MGRTPRPWYRSSRREWRVVVGGHDYCLLREASPEDQPLAEDAYHQLRVDLTAAKRASESPAVPVLGPTVVRWLAALAARRDSGEITAKYYAAVTSVIHTFVDRFGGRTLASITADDITAWLYSRQWGSTQRSYAVGRLRQVWRSAKVAWPNVVTPSPARREAIPTPEQFAELLSALVSPECREILQFIAAVGCRPGESYALEARHMDWFRGVATLTGKTTKKTGHLRVLYIPPEWVARLAVLAAARPEGPLFRSERGRAWNNQLVSWHLQRARKGKDWPWATAYGLRHLFITEALRSHVPIAHVAALVGHVDTSMISRVYSHLTRHDEDLHAALEQARASAAKRRKKKKR